MMFIAEVSSNHAQNLDRCYAFIDASVLAGFDAVKFQLFRMDELFTAKVLEASDDHRSKKQWELPVEFLPELGSHCKKRGIKFSCTPFYLKAVAELEPFVDFYKIASYELLWDDLLIACAKTGKPVIISTGMATLDEVKHAVSVLRQHGCSQLTVLHCTSVYPAPPEEVNLSAIETLRVTTDCPVGWSDHTVEPAVIYRAIHRFGATVVELHLDLDGEGAEFKTGHCWLPDQISAVIKNINMGLRADGSGLKQPAPSEATERQWRADPSDGLRPLIITRTSFCL
jgi:sialic acid synthase SpsE